MKKNMILCDDDPRVKSLLENYENINVHSWFNNPNDALKFLDECNSDEIDLALFDMNFSLIPGVHSSLNPHFNKQLVGICNKKGIQRFYTSASSRTSFDFLPPRHRFIPKKRLEVWLSEIIQ